MPNAFGDRRVIVVGGAGRASFETDRVTLTMQLQSAAADPDRVQREFDAFVGVIRDRLTLTDVPADRITIVETSRDNGFPGRAVMRQTLRIELDSTAHAGRVHDTLADLITTSSSVTSEPLIHIFSAAHSNRDPQVAADALAKARREALLNARSDAAEIVEVYGMRLGPPLFIGPVVTNSFGAETRTVTASVRVAFEIIE